MPPFSLKLSWSSPCPPGCSQSSSSAGLLYPGAQMEPEKPLDPASVCVWLHTNMTRLCKRVSVVTYVFGISSLCFPFYQRWRPSWFQLPLYTATDILSNLIHIGTLLLLDSFYLKGCFSFIYYRNQRASDKERDAMYLCLNSCSGLV